MDDIIKEIDDAMDSKLEKEYVNDVVLETATRIGLVANVFKRHAVPGASNGMS